MKVIILICLFLNIFSNTYAQGQSILAPNIEVISDFNEPEEDSEEESFYVIENKEIIGKEKIKNRNADHVTELLQDIPGVSIVGGATPQFRTVTIRGMDGFRVVQQVDGARRYEQTQNSLSSDIGIESESLKSITVEKGAESLTNASGAIGGTVLYRTLNPSDLLSGNETVASEFKTSFSSASQSFGQALTTAAKVAKKTGILLQATLRTIDRTQSGGNDVDTQSSELNYRRESYMAKVENKSFLGKIVAKASHATTESIDTAYRAGYQDATSDYKDETTEGTINHKYTSPTNPYINLNTNLFANKRESKKITDTPWLGFQSTVGETNDRMDQIGGKMANRSVFSFGPTTFLESEIGFSFQNLNAEEQSGDDVSFYGKSLGRDQSVFVMNNLSMFNDKVILKAGARVSEYERRSEKLAVESPDKSGSTFSNVIGLTVKPIPYLDLYAKLSNSNRAPEVRELYLGGGQPFACHFPRKICNNVPNPNLNEELAYAREVGIDLHNKKTGTFKTNLKVSYFYEQISDYIETMPNMYRIVSGTQVTAGPSTATHRDYTNMNLNQVLRQGIEAQINLQVDNFSFSTKYSAMNMDCKLCPVMFDASTTGEPLYTAPADKAVASVEYLFSKINLNLGYRGEFVNNQRRLSARYQRAGFGTPGYSVHNAFVGWEPTFDLTGKFRLDLAVENFTNKKYQVHNSGSGAFELGQNLKVSFNKYF